ncbi:MAG: hypothetical protein AAGG75_23230 [Bacteroidota bacterium]
MKSYHSYIFLLLLLGLSFSLNAQTEGKRQTPPELRVEEELANAKRAEAVAVLPPRRAYLYLESIKPVAFDPAQLDEATPQTLRSEQALNYKLILKVFAPSTIAKIHVKLGSAEGQADVVNQTFVFDQQAELPFSFTRDGPTIMLGLGRYANTSAFYGEVILENLDGQRSIPKRFSTKG